MTENKKEKFSCSVRGLEIKEIEGEFHITGLISTSHLDLVNDIVPFETMNLWAKQINEGLPKVNKISYHHKIEEKVVGVMRNASVIKLPDMEYGLKVDVQLNKTIDNFDDIIYEIKNGFVDGFSIEYNTHQNKTAKSEYREGKQIRVLLPETELMGAALASRPAQPEAIILNYGYKEIQEVKQMEEIKEIPVAQEAEPQVEVPTAAPIVEEAKEVKVEEVAPVIEAKETTKVEEIKETIAQELQKIEVKNKVIIEGDKMENEIPMEVKEYSEVFSGKLSVKEQFNRAGKLADKLGLHNKTGTAAEKKTFKNFGTNGSKLEYKGLGIGTNSTTYTQSSAELSDVYDPIIYNALNQKTVLWNLLAKDDFSSKGNNKVQFTLKTAANTTAAFYTGNAVTLSQATREKFETKFKKLQVGVSVDGDMLAASKGGPIGDVFAQEVMDSTMDMLQVLNAALFAEVGLETAAGVIGLEFIADSAGNTTMYGLTRSAANKLAPDAAGDTYINGASAAISMANLRSAIKQAVIEGANRNSLVFVTHPIQANILRGKFDDSRRMLSDKDTGFGFSTDLFVDGIPVFEDKDCTSDNWHLVDLETHRVAIWVPPTLEMLGKLDDSEGGFIKMYLAVYNRLPRACVMIYDNATA